MSAPIPLQAARAYAASAATRHPRAQEADIFRRANAGLRHAGAATGSGNSIARARALADNDLLWNTVLGLVRDPENALPLPLRASIVSIGLAVQRENRRAAPDYAFLIAVNESIAAGLSGLPA